MKLYVIEKFLGRGDMRRGAPLRPATEGDLL